ncbi:hypothetical protein V1460_28560 [Streptomyces sp. SCSIO 30461]|uniref:hypothetical protein n=1 Tax=Streptomyces sp. SCSIO 30461 TaxID=3118085 RepID=UPI0030D268C8
MWHWTGLAVFTLTLPPAALAVLTGRVPHRLRTRPASMCPLGLALPALHAGAPINALPRMTDTSPTATLAATATAGTLAVSACVTVAAVTTRSVRATVR